MLLQTFVIQMNSLLLIYLFFRIVNRAQIAITVNAESTMIRTMTTTRVSMVAEPKHNYL